MSTAKAGKRPLRSLTAHEKLSAIKRVSVGGESKASVARDIGVPESTLRGWCKNQEKISYQVQTSPTNTEDTSEDISLVPSAKRIKLEDQPYNLSMKGSNVSSGSYSPDSENHLEGKYRKSTEAESDSSPLNLRTTKPALPSPVIAATPKAANTSTSCTSHQAYEKEKEREKNKAELARLSAELGLNRPEVLTTTLNSANMPDVATLLMQYKSVYQMWYYQHKMLQQQQSKPSSKGASPTDTKMPSPTNGLSNGLLTTVDKRDKMLPSIEQQPSVYDSVSYWLRQQSLIGLNNVPLPNTSAVTSGTNTCATASQNANEQLRLWNNWYQQSAMNNAQLQVPAAAQPQLSPPQPENQQILYQQLTKEPERDLNSENEITKEEKPKNINRNRSVLDNLLLNNNTIQCSLKKEEESSLNTEEALEHGEKFLHWLEHCSDPAVTTLQLHTVQSLIKNLKSGIDRRSNDCQNRIKVRRK